MDGKPDNIQSPTPVSWLNYAALVRALRQANLAQPVRVIGTGRAAAAYLRDLAGSGDGGTAVLLVDLRLPFTRPQRTLHRVLNDPRLRSVPVAVLGAQSTALRGRSVAALFTLPNPRHVERVLETARRLAHAPLLTAVIPDDGDADAACDR